MKYVRRKFIGLGLRISNYFKFSFFPFLPLHLDIEPINICNFNCNHCKVTYWNKNKEELNLQKFIKILDQFPNLKSVKLQGLGEPLLNKEFSKLIVECRNRGIYLEFFTNGSIYKQEVWDTINETKKINVIFNIDATTKEKFERIRTNSDFKKMISNIEKIIKNKEQKYSFWTVVTKENLTELSEIILLANKLGVSKVTFQTFLSDWKNTEAQKFNQTISFDKKFDEQKILLKKLKILQRNMKLDWMYIKEIIYQKKINVYGHLPVHLLLVTEMLFHAVLFQILMYFLWVMFFKPLLSRYGIRKNILILGKV